VKTCFHKKCGVFEACKKVKDFFDTLKFPQPAKGLWESQSVKNYCFPILCRVSEAGAGADASVCPMSSREFSQYSVGADAYIGPPGSCEFAADYRKNGAICRVDATPAG